MELNTINNQKEGINIFICDDLEEERIKLYNHITEFLGTRNQKANISFFDSGEAMLGVLDESNLPHIIFQDIYMGGMSGVDTCRELRKISEDTEVIFTTTSREHGADAFEVDAFHYLVKPIEKEKFEKVMGKWLSAYYNALTVTVKTGRTEKNVAVHDIVYIEINKRMCTIHTLNDVIDTPPPLATLEALLPPEHFFKPIRYCIVAYRHVLKVNNEGIVMNGGAVLPISRLKKDEVKNSIAAYRLKMLRGR